MAPAESEVVVDKFGGSVLRRPEDIAEAVAVVERQRTAGLRPVVVVSAFEGVTDTILGAARVLLPDSSGLLGEPVQDADSGLARETDRALATGEALSAALFALGLQGRGIPARSFSGAEAGIRTAAAHLGAEVRRVLSRPLRAALAEGLVPVVAGFQGIGTHGELTTLGAGARTFGRGPGSGAARRALRAVQGCRRRARGRSAPRARRALPARGRRPPARAAGRDGRRGRPSRCRPPSTTWSSPPRGPCARRRRAADRGSAIFPRRRRGADAGRRRKERMARISLVGPAALTPELLPLPAHGEGAFDEGGLRVVWAEVPVASAASAAQAVHASFMEPALSSADPRAGHPAGVTTGGSPPAPRMSERRPISAWRASRGTRPAP